MRQPRPLRAFGARIRARRGHQVAAVAVARSSPALPGSLLTKGEDYVFERPQLTQRKLRRLELAAGEPHRRGNANGLSSKDPEREAVERATAERAEATYRRLVADWKASGAAAQEWARVPHAGAQQKQRGRDQPRNLRFGSR
jgi:transposase